MNKAAIITGVLALIIIAIIIYVYNKKVTDLSVGAQVGVDTTGVDTTGATTGADVGIGINE